MPESIDWPPPHPPRRRRRVLLIAEWLSGQRMNSVTRLRLAKRLRAFISV